MAKTILVTGASGNLGSAVVSCLAKKGFTIKAASRKPEELKLPAGAKSIFLDYDILESIPAALSGVDGVFLIAPPMDPEAPAKLKPLIEAAKEKANLHIVFNSALGVDMNEKAPLRIVERMLIEGQNPYTILRPNFFMDNFSKGFIAPMINEAHSIFLAAADAKTSFISTGDIAEIAAIAFSEEHYGRQYNLTGPKALDHYEIAAIIGESIGEKIDYVALEEEAMLEGARQNGLPESAVQYMAVLYNVVRAGYMAAITSDIEKVSGQKASSFETFMETNKNCFIRAL